MPDGPQAAADRVRHRDRRRPRRLQGQGLAHRPHGPQQPAGGGGHGSGGAGAVSARRWLEGHAGAGVWRRRRGVFVIISLAALCFPRSRKSCAPTSLHRHRHHHRRRWSSPFTNSISLIVSSRCGATPGSALAGRAGRTRTSSPARRRGGCSRRSARRSSASWSSVLPSS